jgi:type I restriction enzyme S subunit
MNSDDRQLIKLNEFAELINQPYQPSSGENLYYIGLEHIEQQTLRIIGIGDSSDVISQKHRFVAGDILFGKLRPYFRKVVKPTFDGVCSTDIWVIGAKPGFDQKFLFYFLANQCFIDACNRSSSGTRMPRADWAYLSETLWELPFLPQQQYIGEILSALDDKIELNRQTNKTLEEIAQAIFKEWFIDFNYPGATGEVVESILGLIPKGWRIQSLGDLSSTITKGTTPTTLGDDFVEKGVRFLRVDCINETYGLDESKSLFITQETHEKLRRSQLIQNDILITIAGSIGRLSIVTERVLPANLNQAIGIIRIDENIVPVNYIFQYLKQPIIRDKLLSGVTQSVQANISLQDLRSLLIIIPSKQVLFDYQRILEPIRDYMDNNNNQSSTLQTIRETLLPKLMRGESEL